TSPSLVPGEKEASSRVLLVPVTQTRSLVGCDYVGLLKTSTACPSGQDAETCTAFRAAQDGGNAVMEGPPQRVYRCPEARLGPTTASVVSSPPVRVVTSEDERKGCVYRDRVDTSIECPPSYPEGAPCMAYRARQQGGDTVLTQGTGRVYQCSSSSTQPK